MAKTDYPGCKEIHSGVFVDYDEEDPAIYIVDKEGEVVMWTFDEVQEDPTAWTASLTACALAAKHGPSAVRALLTRSRRDTLS